MRSILPGLVTLLLLFAAACSFDTAGIPATGGPGPKVDAGSDGSAKDSGDPGDIGPRPDKPKPTKDKGAQDSAVTQDKGSQDKGSQDKGSCAGPLYKCKGKDQSQICKNGSYVPFKKCPMDCHQASGKCNNFNALNGAGGYIDKESGKWTVSGQVVLDTDTGKFTPDQTGAKLSVYKTGTTRVVAVGTMEITPTGTLKAQGALPLIIVASDKIVINGTLDVSADGTIPGPGGSAGGGKGQGGKGCGGGPKGKSTSYGGAGGSHGGKGGWGSKDSSAPKATCGQACPAPLVGGSGGGDGDAHYGLGGAGGGAVQLTAWNSISVGGSINAGGGGGRGGKAPDFIFEWVAGGGGGGGSGGAIILEAPVLTVGGTVGANGAGGGGSGSISTSGGNGKDGSASFSAAGGGAEGITVSAGKGGNGSSQLTLSGSDGADGLLSAGGGGGGAGRMCVHTKSGSYSGKGGLSPAGGSTASSLQKLTVVAP